MYPSKVDTWIRLVLWTAAASQLFAVFTAVSAERAAAAVGVVMLVTVLPVVLIVWILARTRYELSDGHLRAQCGPFQWRVPYDQIVEVVPSRSALSSPALSLDRLLVRYGSSRILISPAAKAAFLVDLAARCPQLRRQGENHLVLK